MPANNVPNVPPMPVEPDVPGAPTPANPDAPPTGPEPSVDTTKREAPGPNTHGPVTEPPDTTDPSDPSKAPKSEAPKLPHERDQSVDMTHGQPDANVEQAYKDVKRGLKDTDEALRATHVETHQAP